MNYNNIFDVHAHYDDEKFDEDREELLASLPQLGVKAVVNASVDLDTAKKAIEFSQKYPFMYAAVGIHPENLEGLSEDYLKKLAEFYENNKKVVALAAIGLGTSITDFKKAGLAPMFYGVTIDTLVTLTALGVIWLMGLM